MSLSPLDDYPVHQIAEPIRHVGHERPQLLRPLLLQPPRARRRALPASPGFGAVPEPRHVRRVRRDRRTTASTPSCARRASSARPHGHDGRSVPRRGASRGCSRLRVVLEPNEWDFELRPDLRRARSRARGAAPLLAPARARHLRHLPPRPDRPLGGHDRPSATRHFDVTPDRWWGMPRPLVGRPAGRRARAARASAAEPPGVDVGTTPRSSSTTTRSSTWSRRTSDGGARARGGGADLERPGPPGRVPRVARARARVRARARAP